MKSNLEFITLNKLGFLICDVPKEIMDYTRKEAKRMIASGFKNKQSYRYGLVGALEHEYKFAAPTKALNAFFKEIVPEYLKQCNDVKTVPAKLAPNTHFLIPEESDNIIPDSPPIWINFQKKYEHNPIHVHTGTLSFVYWVQIPYDIEKEANLPHTKIESMNQEHKCSSFTFHYPINLPNASGIYNHHIFIDKSWEGKMILFPSWLHHSVTPFYTSDDYRISVAGNLY